MKNFLKAAFVASIVSVASVPILAVAASAVVPAPAAPTISSVISQNRSIAVTWTEVTTGSTFRAVATADHHATRSCHTNGALKCKIVALVNGVTYGVVVSATNSGGTTASLSSSITVGAPSAPNGAHARASSGGNATLSWNPPKSSGISAVTSYSATATNGSSTFSCTTTATSTVRAARNCSVTGLTTGLVYSVSVTATNAFGTSPSSKSVSFTAL